MTKRSPTVVWVDEMLSDAWDEEQEQALLAKYYGRMHFNNLVRRAESVQGHLAMQTYRMTTPIPPYLASGKENYGMTTTVVRHRFSKEIAEELLNDKQEFAYLYALEKLANDTNHPQLWRDVMLWLDEMEKPYGGTVDTDDTRPRGEQTHRADDDSEDSHT